MKTNIWVKKVLPYFLLFVWIFLSKFFDDISGKHALFNKAFMTFPYIIIGIIALIAVVLSVKRISSKKLQINLNDIIYNLFFVIVAVAFITLNFNTTIAICNDVIEGKHFTTLEISNDSKIADNGFFDRKYYLKGTTSDGEYITLEISDNDFINIIIVSNANLIKIDYWRNSKTLCNWTDISNRDVNILEEK